MDWKMLFKRDFILKYGFTFQVFFGKYCPFCTHQQEVWNSPSNFQSTINSRQRCLSVKSFQLTATERGCVPGTWLPSYIQTNKKSACISQAVSTKKNPARMCVKKDENLHRWGYFSIERFWKCLIPSLSAPFHPGSTTDECFGINTRKKCWLG